MSGPSDYERGRLAGLREAYRRCIEFCDEDEWQARDRIEELLDALPPADPPPAPYSGYDWLVDEVRERSADAAVRTDEEIIAAMQDVFREQVWRHDEWEEFVVAEAARRLSGG